MTPIISVIIPCYNQGQYINDAINSVEQVADKSLYEILIVNDGSTDDFTKRILISLEEKGYNVINQENLGLSTARNNGILASKGKYLLPLDADNKIRPAYIEKGITILEKKGDIGLVYADAFHFEGDNKVVKSGKFNIKRMMLYNFVDACAVIRKKAWEQTGGYDPTLTAMEDWDMNLSLAELGWKFHYIPEVLFDYRVRKESMLRTYQNSNSQVLQDYIARKHGILYRNEFFKTIKLSDRIKSLCYDFVKKITGNPNY
ncbi:hypothetical protein CAP36_15125 [Chitinophagaceae bacterium IBVUCB2]|nr:hypothetical protein CAP36_15125 [Chitinophagaceae bacterium IBVUCB2]